MKRAVRQSLACLVLIASGCSPNSGGPSAPSAIPGWPTQIPAPKPGDKPTVPLRQVGQPIGVLSFPPLFR